MPHSTAHDETFREIQLNGKQLVFLFMAATVVSVVIFLCGVLVGRGVRPVVTETATAASGPVAPNAVVESPLPTASSAAAPVAAEPPPTPNELTYYDRLEKKTPPIERLKPAREAPRVESEQVRSGVREPPTRSVAAPKTGVERKRSESRQAPVALGTSGDPSGSGYAVQVAALRGQREADAIARRLADKGYPAYVMTPSTGAPAAVFRVRVGKFSSRREADQIAGRLQKEEQFKPWIVR